MSAQPEPHSLALASLRKFLDRRESGASAGAPGPASPAYDQQVLASRSRGRDLARSEPRHRVSARAAGVVRGVASGAGERREKTASQSATHSRRAASAPPVRSPYVISASGRDGGATNALSSATASSRRLGSAARRSSVSGSKRPPASPVERRSRAKAAMRARARGRAPHAPAYPPHVLAASSGAEREMRRVAAEQAARLARGERAAWRRTPYSGSSAGANTATIAARTRPPSTSSTRVVARTRPRHVVAGGGASSETNHSGRPSTADSGAADVDVAAELRSIVASWAARAQLDAPASLASTTIAAQPPAPPGITAAGEGLDSAASAGDAELDSAARPFPSLRALLSEDSAQGEDISNREQTVQERGGTTNSDVAIADAQSDRGAPPNPPADGDSSDPAGLASSPDERSAIAGPIRGTLSIRSPKAAESRMTTYGSRAIVSFAKKSSSKMAPPVEVGSLPGSPQVSPRVGAGTRSPKFYESAEESLSPGDSDSAAAAVAAPSGLDAVRVAERLSHGLQDPEDLRYYSSDGGFITRERTNSGGLGGAVEVTSLRSFRSTTSSVDGTSTLGGEHVEAEVDGDGSERGSQAADWHSDDGLFRDGASTVSSGFLGDAASDDEETVEDDESQRGSRTRQRATASPVSVGRTSPHGSRRRSREIVPIAVGVQDARDGVGAGSPTRGWSSQQAVYAAGAAARDTAVALGSRGQAKGNDAGMAQTFQEAWAAVQRGVEDAAGVVPSTATRPPRGEDGSSTAEALATPNRPPPARPPS